MKTLLIFCRNTYEVRKTNKRIKNGIFTYDDVSIVVCTSVRQGLKAMAKFDTEVGNKTDMKDYIRTNDIDYTEDLEMFFAGDFEKVN